MNNRSVIKAGIAILLSIGFICMGATPAHAAPKSGWEKNGSSWYYRTGNGNYHKGWLTVKGSRYYLASNGRMVTGWQELGGDWYYFNPSGAMAQNKWVGNYYVSSSGVMLRDTWISGKYYVDMHGKWDPNRGRWMEDGTGRWYKLSSGGYVKNQWRKISGDWYYFDSRGYMVTNTWIGDYYLLNDGKMATNQWIDQKHYVGADGRLQPDRKYEVKITYHAALSRQIFDEINQERIKHGLEPFIWSANYSEPFSRIQSAYNLVTYAEQPGGFGMLSKHGKYGLGQNGGEPAAEIAKKACGRWMESPGHRAGLLSTYFDYYAVALTSYETPEGEVMISCIGLLSTHDTDYRMEINTKDATDAPPEMWDGLLRINVE